MIAELVGRDEIAALLREHGATPSEVVRVREIVHAERDSEPGDWRQRLPTGAQPRALELLLAIVRTADCHGYRLLEAIGTACPALRRTLAERTRGAAAMPPGRRATARGEANGMRTTTRATRTPRVVERGPIPAVRSRSRGPTVPSPSRPTAEPHRPRLAAATEPSDPIDTPPLATNRAPSPRAGDAQELAARMSSARSSDTQATVVRTSSARSSDAQQTTGVRMSSARANEAHDLVARPNELQDTSARASAPRPSETPVAAVEREPARLHAIDPAAVPQLFGRDEVLARLHDALARTGMRPVALVGPTGSGRTALARGLAVGASRPVFALSALDYRDDDDEMLRTDLRAVAAKRGLAIFDDLDRTVHEAAPAWLSSLVYAWLRDEPRVLPIVGPEGLARLAQWVPGVLEATDLVRIESLEGPALAEAVTAGAAAVLASHGVTLAADLRPAELARLADRYLVGLALPGRALDLLDLACARARRCGERTLGRARLHELVAERSGLPRARIEARGDDDAIELEARLAEHVVGHTHAIAAIGELVRRNRAGLGGARPIIGALLLGPSGVGKTELAKALARALFERDDALVRLDMSEYAEPHALARIVGAPPGYVGHEQGGALTDPLLRRPHTVVLLDEIEKAHRDVHQLLLQVLDEGRLTDGRGRTIDFRHAAILMTSNLGADRIRRRGAEIVMDEAEVLAAARAAFPVELWNRIEAPLVMQPLRPGELLRVAKRLVRSASERLMHERGVRYELSAAASEHLVARAGTDPTLGARPLRHLIVREIEPLVADAVLRGRVRAGGSLLVDVEGDGFALR